MTEVRVKKLEWANTFGTETAPSIIGVYAIQERSLGFFVRFNGKDLAGKHKTEALAKAAAQADFECRVLSCLEMPNE